MLSSDTMDVTNLELNGLVYQGGDDCIAVKPHSYNIRAKNITCHGGNGIAIGSLGQYLTDASVANIVVDNVTVRLFDLFSASIQNRAAD